jgi:hypothetical protein
MLPRNSPGLWWDRGNVNVVFICPTYRGDGFLAGVLAEWSRSGSRTIPHERVRYELGTVFLGNERDRRHGNL